MTANQFKKFRLHLGYTQGRLAKAFGVSTRQIRRYEDGQTKVHKILAMLCECIKDGKIKI